MKNSREIVSGSLRTNNATISVDAFLKRALGTDPRGRPYGGGRTRAGGFEIEVGFLAGAEDAEFTAQKWALFDRQIRQTTLPAVRLYLRPDEDDYNNPALCMKGYLMSQYRSISA